MPFTLCFFQTVKAGEHFNPIEKWVIVSEENWITKLIKH